MFTLGPHERSVGRHGSFPSNQTVRLRHFLKTCPQSKDTAIISHQRELKRRDKHTHDYSKEQPVACFKTVKSGLRSSLKFDHFLSILYTAVLVTVI